MATNKFFKSLLFASTIAINLFSFGIQDSSAYPVFAQQNYSNPRAANGKLACANCHELFVVRDATDELKEFVATNLAIAIGVCFGKSSQYDRGWQVE